MIRVHKPEEAPRALRERGPALTVEICSRIDVGQLPSFDSGVYGHEEVRRALKAAQHDKCCFCESKLSHTQFGDVEHFRPKKATRQSAGQLPAPGYYWLAYDWSNLYLSCEVCNRRHKRDLFPLVNPEQRVSSHHRAAELDAEQPLFIDPGREDPERFIEFRGEYAAPVARDERGAATVAALELNRRDLCDERRDRRRLLRNCLTLVAVAIEKDVPIVPRDDVLLALDALVASAAHDGQWASMTRSLLRQVTPWRPLWKPPTEALLDALQADAREGRAMRLDGR